MGEGSVLSNWHIFKGGLREATTPLALGLTMIHGGGYLRVCTDHMKDWLWMTMKMALAWCSSEKLWCEEYNIHLMLSEETSSKFGSTQGLTGSDAQCSGGFSVRIRMRGVCQLRWLPDPSLCVFKSRKPDFSEEEIWRNNSPLRLMSLLEQSLKDNSVQ